VITPTIFSSEQGNYYALQGVHALEEPGLIDFCLSVTHEDGVTETFTQPVLVTPGLFDEDPPLRVDPATIDPSITGPENELVSAIVSNITPTKYWQSIFQALPITKNTTLSSVPVENTMMIQLFIFILVLILPEV